MSAMRLAIAYSVRYFDWQFAPGDDGSSIYTEEKWQFSRRPGPLRCVFTCRNQDDCDQRDLQM